ncbi:uncharacterized protein BDV17DRAFT_198375 [Aspergillus undulatus]|uniref:uncharacterized protein n=1 Tax=Aspergillus undulatus TaxID=1810928 RepID=UPI003CCD972D
MYEVHIGITRHTHAFGRQWVVILRQEDSEPCDWYCAAGGRHLFRPYEREHLPGKHFFNDDNLFVRKIHFCDFVETYIQSFIQLNETEPGPNIYFVLRWFWSCALQAVLPLPCVLLLHYDSSCYSRRETFDNNCQRLPVDEDFVNKWKAQTCDQASMDGLGRRFWEHWPETGDMQNLAKELEEFVAYDKVELGSMEKEHFRTATNTFQWRFSS